MMFKKIVFILILFFGINNTCSGMLQNKEVIALQESPLFRACTPYERDLIHRFEKQGLFFFMVKTDIISAIARVRTQPSGIATAILRSLESLADKLLSDGQRSMSAEDNRLRALQFCLRAKMCSCRIIDDILKDDLKSRVEFEGNKCRIDSSLEFLKS